MGVKQKDIEYHYKILVAPKIIYALVVWAAANETDLKKINQVRSRAVQMGIITNYECITEIIKDQDMKLLSKCQNSTHVLHSFIPERTNYAYEHLRSRQPAPDYFRTEKNSRHSPQEH